MPSHDAPSADERVAADEVDVWLAGRRRSWIVGNLAVVSFVLGVAGIVAAVTLKVRYDAALSSRTGEMQVIESRIEYLKIDQAARHADLEALHRSIEESRDELVTARRQAQVAQCRAATPSSTPRSPSSRSAVTSSMRSTLTATRTTRRKKRTVRSSGH